MKNIGIALLSLFIVFPIYSNEATKLAAQDKYEYCDASNEFVAVYSYLQEHKEFGLKKIDLMSLAKKVTQGCSGAAKRFIIVSDNLIRAQLDSASSIKIATEFAQSTNDQAEAFVEVFKIAFLTKYLDLNIFNSIKLARDLSIDFEGNAEVVKRDFSEITKYCIYQAKLSKTQCSFIAQDIVKSSAKHDQDLTESFKNFQEFLTEEGPKLAHAQALKVAQDVLKYGPKSAENFQKAYRFAVDSDGLKLSSDDAVNFASKISQASMREKSL